jgi:hypothetical protein
MPRLQELPLLPALREGGWDVRGVQEEKLTGGEPSPGTHLPSKWEVWFHDPYHES